MWTRSPGPRSERPRRPPPGGPQGSARPGPRLRPRPARRAPGPTYHAHVDAVDASLSLEPARSTGSCPSWRPVQPAPGLSSTRGSRSDPTRPPRRRESRRRSRTFECFPTWCQVRSDRSYDRVVHLGVGWGRQAAFGGEFGQGGQVDALQPPGWCLFLHRSPATSSLVSSLMTAVRYSPCGTAYQPWHQYVISRPQPLAQAPCPQRCSAPRSARSPSPPAVSGGAPEDRLPLRAGQWLGAAASSWMRGWFSSAHRTVFGGRPSRVSSWSVTPRYPPPPISRVRVFRCAAVCGYSARLLST